MTLNVKTPHSSETLENERTKATFSIEEMDRFINGDEFVALREKLLAIMRSEPDIFDQKSNYFMARTEKMEKALKQEKRAIELFREGRLKFEEIPMLFNMLDWHSPYHFARGIPGAIEVQGTKEQAEVFAKPVRNLRALGCYAQTEMGHGSNVQGIETTATFIEETDEFEINSPTLTSTKWWIGSLGVVANFAFVMAQLIIKGKRLGAFPIIVPIRSTEDHQPLPGITVGDIGPKMGFPTMDNGFLRFDKVRVPRFNLLQRFINVSRNGTVTVPSDVNPKIVYSALVSARAHLINDMGIQLAKGVTVATRYTAIRRQFGEPGKFESPVLDYDIVQYRLIPLIAKAYTTIGMNHEFDRKYKLTMEDVKRDDFTTLQEMHAITCSLKKWTSDTTVYGIDTCRHLCGGHGYSIFSGLNEFFSSTYQNIIWEGDNFVLAKQTASYLVKSAFAISRKEKADSNDSINIVRKFMNIDPRIALEKLYSWSEMSAEQIANNESVLLDMLGIRLWHLVHKLVVKVYRDGQKWDESSVASQGIATAHSEYIVCLYFGRHINQLPQNSNLRPILLQLLRVTAISGLLRNTGDLFMLPKKAKITENLITGLETEYMKAIKSVRGQAVPLVDALRIPDEKLNSSLGKYDGNVYEDYMKRALDEPLNRKGSGEEIRKRFYKNYIERTLKDGLDQKSSKL
ncbi:hypothetical protein BB559_002093 [Furculomyces boomerangus]|uniref:Acyl-coenzyme A oxidase n=1 Tax=Furculomyces boomerangus TaxID=61424 RepID=A0A2T9YY81_9FUNG|nr:hypothetical protein BB559_002093 [Furculomyces boomerangus]